MKPAVIEDNIFEFEPFEEDGSVQMAAETPWRGGISSRLLMLLKF